MRHVLFCTPTPKRAFDQFIASMEAAVPVLDRAGIGHSMVFEVGSAYISWARANLLGKGMAGDVDVFVFLDHDLSFPPDALLKLITHPGDVVAGDYRFKMDEERYMGRVDTDENGRPIVRADGTIRARAVPAGFLKVTRKAVERFTAAYPELVFGPKGEFIDLFNHGAHEKLWWGEDYAFSRRWLAMGEEIYLIPDLDLTHHLPDRAFPGNLHQFLMRQPGGAKADAQADAPAKAPRSKPLLTRRQSQVAECIKRGKQNKTIAYELGLAEVTVKLYASQAMRKLKATNRTELAYKLRELA